MKSGFGQRCAAFFKQETVLCIAAVLAIVSVAFNPPSAAYAGYIDWETLAMLFSLMAVMKGFQKAGLFVWLGNCLLRRTDTTRKMLFVLVFLPFFCSMVITNDVSLITFVPFALVVLHMAGQDWLVVPLVVLQTVAANLGSMLTPMGNPQNLYLYTKSGMSFFELVGLMLPYALLSAVCLALLILRCESVPVQAATVQSKLAPPRTLAVYGAGFALCLLGIFDVLPPLVIAVITAVFLLFYDRGVLAKVDYSLLGTFIAFFIFIGTVWPGSRISSPRCWTATWWRCRCWPARSSATCPPHCCSPALPRTGRVCSSAAIWAVWVPSSPPWPASSPTSWWPRTAPNAATPTLSGSRCATWGCWHCCWCSTGFCNQYFPDLLAREFFCKKV